ncbi:MAG: DUF3105 domain-containing protein [Deltaproteobacteria bacterium]|nr:DUF3105 domain-containing protein [Deltaproteobacteria bacterium]
MSRLRLAVAWAGLLGAAGCSKAAAPAASPGCEALGVRTGEGGANTHVPSCEDAAACGNGQNPPTGGPHCGTWMACGAFPGAGAAEACQWVHNLEHGHLVLLYNCPAGCTEELAALEAFRKDVPAGVNGVPRALLVPWPTLPGKVGAVVWGTSWVGNAVDEAALRCVLGAQDDAAPEPGLGCAAGM